MIINNFDKNKIFNRRVFLIICFKTALISLLTLRLIYLQIFKHKKYATLSDSNRIKGIITPPLRGKILDRNNNVLATNSSYHRILYNPSTKKKIEETLNKLSKILDLDKSEFLYIRTNALHKKIIRWIYSTL